MRCKRMRPRQHGGFMLFRSFFNRGDAEEKSRCADTAIKSARFRGIRINDADRGPRGNLACGKIGPRVGGHVIAELEDVGEAWSGGDAEGDIIA